MSKITAKDGWTIEYQINGRRSWAAVFDNHGHRRGGVINGSPHLVQEELKWFSKNHPER